MDCEPACRNRQKPLASKDARNVLRLNTPVND
jgi:hypothetical protein